MPGNEERRNRILESVIMSRLNALRDCLSSEQRAKYDERIQIAKEEFLKDFEVGGKYCDEENEQIDHFFR